MSTIDSGARYASPKRRQPWPWPAFAIAFSATCLLAAALTTPAGQMVVLILAGILALLALVSVNVHAVDTRDRMSIIVAAVADSAVCLIGSAIIVASHWW